jgi:hypothetical protein
MTQRFSNRATFAVKVGEVQPPDLRIVDLWAAYKWLTTDDSVAPTPLLWSLPTGWDLEPRSTILRGCYVKHHGGTGQTEPEPTETVYYGLTNQTRALQFLFGANGAAVLVPG